ncbi:hypothetical protein ABT160_14100 [Streptomyces sp. NPDC001941]|uniref:hypothetical protein n=1 Tax=Streptomyces sp. NPDC001941 TaxID=3154659 RepID=UPI00333415B0
MHRHASRTAALAAAATILCALGAGTAAAVERPTEPGELTLIDTPGGRALADKDGNPLYLREADQPDTPDCTGDCATTWPAAVGYPTKADGVTGDTAQTPGNAEGAEQPQVIYDTHPLYYYKDDQPRQPKGQAVEGWSLIAADGTPLPAAPAADASASASPSGSAEASASAAATPGASTPAADPSASTGASTGTGTDPSASTGADSGTTGDTPTAAPSDGSGVGSLRATPSGAARGGADRATASTADAGAAEYALAIGATSAAAAGAILVIRRHQRRERGGRS